MLFFCMVDVFIDNIDDEKKIFYDVILFFVVGLYIIENCNIFFLFF